MAKQTPGVYLSFLQQDGSHAVARIADARLAYADLLASDIFEDAVYAGMVAFVGAGYEDSETVYATLYQVAPSGQIDWSECFPIDGPSA